MDETVARVGCFLFYNPWSTLPVISALLGLKRGEQKILQEKAFFERVRIPCSDRRGYQDAYSLTAKGQRELVGRYRSPQFLSEALLLQFDRLAKVRQTLVQLHTRGRLVWSISPWRASRRSPYFDALVALKRGRGQGSLAVLVFPITNASLEWYLDLLQVWLRWRRETSAIPALLVFWTPPLKTLARKFLSRVVTEDPGSQVVWIFNSAEDRKGHFEPLMPFSGGSGQIAIWKLPDTTPLDFLIQEAFVQDTRRSPFPKAKTTLHWIEKDSSGLAQSLLFFQRTSAGQIQVLEMIARFPGLSAWGYRKLNPKKKASRALVVHLRSLERVGFVSEVKTSEPGFLPQYFLTESGLALLAGLSGVSVKDLNRYLGWPVRPGHFREQSRHMELILDFMLSLQEQHGLLAWDFTASRYLFSDVELVDGKKIRRLVIQPDSAGAILLNEGRYHLFWLEVDRGTRRGKSLDWKLEKYFLAQAARLASGPIPVILYLVDTDQEQDENRLRFISRKLEFLSQKHLGTPLTMLLTTGDLLRHATSPFLDARIWRRFGQDRFFSDICSFRGALEKGQG